MTTIIRFLPDGSGRVRIHWFRRDPAGPIQNPEHITLTSLGILRLGGGKGQIACMPEQVHLLEALPSGQSQLSLYSDDPRAATCPECLQTEAHQQALALLKDLTDPREALAATR